jgi:DNA-directed RNA polymerase subunit RPC12/RpoP
VTPDLFPGTKPPRARPRVLMHVSDAGDSGCCSESGRVKPIVKLACARCGAETEWLIFDTVTEAKRGIPCETCNGGTNA